MLRTPDANLPAFPPSKSRRPQKLSHSLRFDPECAQSMPLGLSTGALTLRQWGSPVPLYGFLVVTDVNLSRPHPRSVIDSGSMGSSGPSQPKLGLVLT
ncbi:unnamed protein product [Macrosiphum euphorbiae]|uniref:Uncharacterized protein n=1 Tax=Macrosiphum euphorbiae TaxID=13131 RepID=A0AAV0XPU8_9HEMI|nr:unnamed protein product [Macrosiphum euphorbiae]